MPNFQKEAKEMGTLMREVVTLLSRHIDAYAKEKLTMYKDNLLYNLLKDTEKVKARLLYYFPLSYSQTQEQVPESEMTTKNQEDSWIGWHNDSGFLTALAGEMYVNDVTGEILSQSPDPKAGLYIMNRSGKLVHVQIPHDCMAVQLGECVQIITGGGLAATPHCVRGVDPRSCLEDHPNIHVARISQVCFIDTVPTFPLYLPKGINREEILSSFQSTNNNVNERVPPLTSRWLQVRELSTFIFVFYVVNV